MNNNGPENNDQKVCISQLRYSSYERLHIGVAGQPGYLSVSCQPYVALSVRHTP